MIRSVGLNIELGNGRAIRVYLGALADISAHAEGSAKPQSAKAFGFRLANYQNPDVSSGTLK